MSKVLYQKKTAIAIYYRKYNPQETSLCKSRQGVDYLINLKHRCCYLWIS
jgi:hypothetical protein